MKYYASIISLSLSHFFHLFFLDVIVDTHISPASVFSKSPPPPPPLSCAIWTCVNLLNCRDPSPLPPSLSIPPVYLIYPGTIPQPPLSTSFPWPSPSHSCTIYPSTAYHSLEYLATFLNTPQYPCTITQPPLSTSSRDPPPLLFLHYLSFYCIPFTRILGNIFKYSTLSLNHHYQHPPHDPIYPSSLSILSTV